MFWYVKARHLFVKEAGVVCGETVADDQRGDYGTVAPLCTRAAEALRVRRRSQNAGAAIGHGLDARDEILSGTLRLHTISRLLRIQQLHNVTEGSSAAYSDGVANTGQGVPGGRPASREKRKTPATGRRGRRYGRDDCAVGVRDGPADARAPHDAGRGALDSQREARRAHGEDYTALRALVPRKWPACCRERKSRRGRRAAEFQILHGARGGSAVPLGVHPVEGGACARTHRGRGEAGERDGGGGAGRRGLIVVTAAAAPFDAPIIEHIIRVIFKFFAGAACIDRRSESQSHADHGRSARIRRSESKGENLAGTLFDRARLARTFPLSFCPPRLAAARALPAALPAPDAICNVVLMAAAIGGLGILSIPHSIIAHPSWHDVARGVQSVLLAVLVLVAVLVIAYRTNPSEASFRQYLTEQSFRRHLSRIDDDRSDDEDGQQLALGPLSAPPKGTLDRLPAPATRAANASSGAPGKSSAPPAPAAASLESSAAPTRLHFHGHASISLRTPPHFIRSFAVLTIAAVTPADAHPWLTTPPGRTRTRAGSAAIQSLVRASWFVGIFGRWWPGGTFPFDSLMFARDDDDPRSGVLAMGAVKQPAHLDGLPVKASARPAPAGLRDRAPAAPKHLPRSSTPPPLPKSASLPLHDTKRGNVSAKRFATDLRPKLPAVEPAASVPEKPSAAAPAPPTPENAFVLKELAQELSASQAQVSDSRLKLANLESSGAASKAALQRELDAQREQKRREDATRAELKTRTKALEDSKRHTDSTKREAEKRLKAACAARDGSTARIERLQRELDALRAGIVQDRQRKERSATDTALALEEITQQQQRYQREISVAEDLIASLNSRTRELEDKIAPEVEKLDRLSADVEAKRHKERLPFLDDADALLHDSPKGLRETASWPPPLSSGQQTATHTPAASSVEPPIRTILRRPPVASSTDPIVTPASRTVDRSRAPGQMSRANSLNKNAFPVAQAAAASTGLLPLHDNKISVSKGYSIFNSELASLGLNAPGSAASTFSPFDSMAGNDFVVQPRTPSTYLPSSLFNPLDSPVSETLTHSANQAPSILAKDDAWQSGGNPLTLRSRTFPPLGTDTADFAPFGPLPRNSTATDGTTATATVRSSRTGLNPDAKVFNPPARVSGGVRPNSMFATGSHSNVSSRMPSPNVPYSAPAVAAAAADEVGGSFFSSLRAFAPSPAEREALSRALGPLGLVGAPAPAPVPLPVPVSAPLPSFAAPAHWAPPQTSRVRLSADRAPEGSSAGGRA